MKASTLLRSCVVLEWVAGVTSVALSFLLEKRLPEPLREWVNSDAGQSLTVSWPLFLAIAVPFLIGVLTSTIGLLFLQRWAAWLYLATTVLGLLLGPLTGPVVEHGVADALDEAAVVLSGMIIALCFWSDALPRANRAHGTRADAATAAP